MSQRFQNPFGDEMQTSGRRRRRPRVHTQGISRKRTVRCVFRRDVGMRPEIAFVSHLALVLHRLEEAKRYDVIYVMNNVELGRFL